MKPLPVVIIFGLIGWTLLLSLFGIIPKAPQWVCITLGLATLIGTFWKLHEVEAMIDRKALEIAAKRERTWHMQQHRAKKIKRLLWIPVYVLILPGLLLLGSGVASD